MVHAWCTHITPLESAGFAAVNPPERRANKSKAGPCYTAQTRLILFGFLAPKGLLQPPVPRRQKLEAQSVQLDESRRILLIIRPRIIFKGHVRF